MSISSDKCCQRQAKRCTAQLAADGAPGASVNVDNIVPLDGGESPVESLSETQSATMPPDARAKDDAPCIIEWDDENDAWIITWVHKLSKSCRATAKGAISGSSGTVDAVNVMDDGQSPVANNTTAELSVNNPENFDIVDDGYCLIVQNGSEWDLVGGSSAPAVFTHYQLLSDLDEPSGSYNWALANPLEWKTATMTWELIEEQVDAYGTPLIDAEWTVIVVDTTLSIGAWMGDFVLGQPLSETKEATYVDPEYPDPEDPNHFKTETFPCVEVTGRMSQQTTYRAHLNAETYIPHGGSLANVAISINGLSVYRTVCDSGLIAAGQYLGTGDPAGLDILVQYMAETGMRKWVVTGAECYSAELL